jgi:serine/threonine-protein phosphatase 2A regulatory subunit B''
LGKATENGASAFLTMDNFVKITKEICSFPTFFNGPLYKRILYLWNTHVIKSQAQRLIIWNEFQKEDIKVGLDPDAEAGEKDELLEHLDTVITKEIFKWYWIEEMEDFDASERFFRLLKKPFENYIGKDDFLPYMKELLRDHPVSLSHILLFLAIVLSPLIFASILL